MTRRRTERSARPRTWTTVAVLLALAVVSAATRSSLASSASSRGHVSDGGFSVTCDRAMSVMAQIRITMSKRDAGMITTRQATVQLSGESAELRSMGRSASDAVLPEALQNVSDAVSAYAAGTADGARATDLRTVAAAAVTGFRNVCPARNDGSRQARPIGL